MQMKLADLESITINSCHTDSTINASTCDANLCSIDKNDASCLPVVL